MRVADNGHTDFEAGKTRFFVQEWENITSDPFVLRSIKNCKLDFDQSNPPTQVKEPRPIQFNQSESKVVENEVQNLLAKGVIEKCEPSNNQYVSNIFVREKKDGRFRVILNLKNLNQLVEYQKFKMETLESIVNLIRPGCFMASLDLKDTYYSVPVAMEDRPFLRFRWEDTLYQFSCLPMGLTSAPRIFTKIMKPVLASL